MYDRYKRTVEENILIATIAYLSIRVYLLCKTILLSAQCESRIKVEISPEFP